MRGKERWCIHDIDVYICLHINYEAINYSAGAALIRTLTILNVDEDDKECILFVNHNSKTYKQLPSFSHQAA